MSKQTKNEFDGNAHTSNDRFSTKNLGFHCYASKKRLVDHGFYLLSLYVVANILFATDIVDSNRLVGHAENFDFF